MTINAQLPRISWQNFLHSAPYFTTAIYDAEIDTPIDQLPPLIRAVYYWGIFNGEVSNGGVAQYFLNKALHLPQFERAPEFVAMNPVLAEALPFMQQAHATWNDTAADVRKARESEDWPEGLFKKYAPVFDELETAFYRVNHAISCRVDQAIIQSPHDYFQIKPLAGVTEKGVSYVEHNKQGKVLCRLRFVDGFPVGPNIFEGDNGHCQVIWFSADRQMLDIESSNSCFSNSTRNTIHYPTLTSTTWRFREEHKLESFETTRALWRTHGIREYYESNGQIRNTSLYIDDTEIRSDWHNDDGSLISRTELFQDTQYETRYWPSGQLSVRSLIEKEGDRERTRYFGCWDIAGNALLANGTGKLYEVLVFNDDGTPQRWREGNVVNGYLEGPCIWREGDQETQRDEFRNGYKQG